MSIKNDNLCPTYLAYNLVFHLRMKHTAELVKQGLLEANHISTKDQVANKFTKPMPLLRFLDL